DRTDQALPVVVVVHRDRDPSLAPLAVGAAVDPVGSRMRRTVARAAEHGAVRRVVEDRLGKADDSTFDLREVEVLALTRVVAVEERGGQQEGGEAGRERVRDRAEGADRLAVGPAREMVEAGERRALPSEAGIEPLRPGLAVEAGADHDQVGSLADEGGV